MSAYIFTGHFGSGKTEVSINFAANIGAEVIVDLDIVNPYFRTKDAEDVLTQRGLRVISPRFAGTNLDIPALPEEISAAFLAKRAVFDVGGDDEGATALGRYHKDFKDYKMYLVVNTLRPGTRTVEDILKMRYEIESASRLKVTYIINNTNLAGETSVETVLAGQKIVEKAAKEAGLPIAFTTARKDLEENLRDKGINVMGLELFLKLPF